MCKDNILDDKKLEDVLIMPEDSDLTDYYKHINAFGVLGNEIQLYKEFSVC